MDEMRDHEVRQFDTVEEMLAYMEEREREANRGVHPRQRMIGFGQYVIRPIQDFLVFGYVYEREERDKGEDRETVSMLDDSYARGYRTGKWHSEVVPEGEIGDAHIVTLWPIFKEEFDAAKAVGFRVDHMKHLDWFLRMVDRVQTERLHRGGAATDPSEGKFNIVEDDS